MLVIKQMLLLADGRAYMKMRGHFMAATLWMPMVTDVLSTLKVLERVEVASHAYFPGSALSRILDDAVQKHPAERNA